MDGVQTKIVLLQLGCLLGLVVPLLGFGLALLTKLGPPMGLRVRVKGAPLVMAGLALLLVMYEVLSSAPAFDVVERCRPNGSGLCRQSKTLAQVQTEIDRDLLQAAVLYLLLPVVVGVSSLMLLIRRHGYL